MQVCATESRVTSSPPFPFSPFPFFFSAFPFSEPKGREKEERPIRRRGFLRFSSLFFLGVFSLFPRPPPGIEGRPSKFGKGQIETESGCSPLFFFFFFLPLAPFLFPYYLTLRYQAIRTCEEGESLMRIFD